MNWHNKYIGKPWASPANPPESFNCGDLVRWVYLHELGIDSPEIHIGCHDFKGHVREVENYLNSSSFVLVKSEDRQEFDIVRMYLGKRPCHVGVYTGSGVLHSLDGVGVVHESVFELKSQYKMEFVRHATRA